MQLPTVRLQKSIPIQAFLINNKYEYQFNSKSINIYDHLPITGDGIIGLDFIKKYKCVCRIPWPKRLVNFKAQ